MKHSASTSTGSSIGAGGRLTIDLAALADNWREVASWSPGAETGAAVKGNGYGVGLEEAVRTLSGAGCRTFFVALPDEGLRARAVAPEAAIYVLNGLAGDTAPVLAGARLRPVLGSLGEVEIWEAFRKRGGEGGAALHVDTGMNRLGLTLDEAAKLAAEPARVAGLGLTLVMTHLACADTPGHPLTETQLGRFRAARVLFPGVPASLANSAGATLGPDYRFELLRPGIALYGGRFVEGRAPLRTVATLEGRVLLVRDVPAGETVGYGASETTKRPSRIAILSVGYADGYHRSAGSRDGAPGARAFLRGRHARLFGRVSMDLLAIDVTDVDGVAAGDWAELIGPNVPVDDVAAAAGTIGYELLTALGLRYERSYRGGA